MTTAPADCPSLAITVPVHNEEAHLAELVASIRRQDYPGIEQVWFVDDASTDASAAVLRELCADDLRMTVLPSTRRGQAAAVNTGFARSTTDLVLRLDAHAVYAPDMVRRQVETLLATGAAGVGVVARPLEDGDSASGRGHHRPTRVAHAIAAVHRSRLGIGAASFRREDASGWVDTIWNGCYWRSIVEIAGPLREDLPRTEDNEFHARLRSRGHRLYLAPDAKAWYQPRTTLPALWRQYWATGRGVAHALRTSPGALGLRHLVPGLFVGALLVLGVGALLSDVLRWVLAGVGVVYGLGLLAATLGAVRTRIGAYVLLVGPALAGLHVGYGAGTLAGLVRSSRRTPIDGGPPRRVRAAVRIVDLLLCVLAAPLVLPVVGLLAALVKLDSPGPALHHGARVGRGGRLYRIHKLRSMVVGAHLAGSGVTTRGDARVTRVGRILRRTKLDELPQLWNVVVGDMSLVGPRPEDPRYVEGYTVEQRVVLTVRPGLTSPASLAYRDEESLLDGLDWERVYTDVVLPDKLAIDAQFVRDLSLRTYLGVLLRTLREVLSPAGATAREARHAPGATPVDRDTRTPAPRIPSGTVPTDQPQETS